MPAFLELTEPLSDELVTLRLAAERDIPEVLIAYQDDPQLHRRMAEERPPSGADLGRRVERAGAERLAGKRLTLTVVEPRDDTCRGQVCVDEVDWDNLLASLRIWIAPDRRGRGYGRSALALAGEWLLREAGLERVQIRVETGNEPMIRAARAAGFSWEGVLRGHMRAGGARLDAAVLSLVRSDLGS
jgi:RimJ/RimL family protein N-acetyltransferase